MPAKQYASDDPLPGGVEQYYDTLVKLLRRVAEHAMSHEQLTHTITEVCPSATQATAIGMYIGSITRMGYWSSKDALFKVTPEGLSLLEKAENDPGAARFMVLENKVRHVAGYDEVIRTLAKGPASLQTVDTALKERLQVDWNSNNQTTFRLCWLRSLGYATREGHSYVLTEAGQAVADSDLIPKKPVKGSGPEPPVDPPPAPSKQVARAVGIAEKVEKAALKGGDGAELEKTTAEAFEFLGFEVEVIGGSGNPDIVATALMGGNTYRVLVETKSRSSGTVSQNDINFNALNEHKSKANADYVVAFATDFSGGNLEKWACEQDVRLLRVGELEQLLLAHAEATITLDQLRELFLGGGSTDEAVVSSVVVNAESSLQLMKLCREVYDAVLEHQEQEALLNEHSLFYILDGAHSIQSVQAATELLQSGLIAALGRTESGSLFCRVSRRTLAERLNQIYDVVGGPPAEGCAPSDSGEGPA